MCLTAATPMPPFSERAADYQRRIEEFLDRRLPAPTESPHTLHEAMRYAALGAGKRVRPLLVYATGEVLGVPRGRLDPCAAAVELIHCYSLVHDDLPAMDDDDLRRGRPTVHRAFDEATAILAGDALQALAFEILASDPGLGHSTTARVAVIAALAEVCGSRGMAGGQAMDLAAERARPSIEALETMFHRKTGDLLVASVKMPCLSADRVDPAGCARLVEFARLTGLAFQIRDDLLEVEGTTEIIGKPAGSDQARAKATYPALAGVETARNRVEELHRQALAALAPFGSRAEPLVCMAENMINRQR